MSSNNKVLRPKAAADFIGVSVSTIYLWSKSPDFPPRLRIGPRASGWRREDLEKWLDDREEVA